jgi:hypothetical protein
MRRYKKHAVWGAAFATLVTLGAATAAWTAGAAPFGAQATTTITSTVTTGGSTIVTTITTTTPDSTSASSTGSTSTDTTATDTTSTDTTSTDEGGGGGNAPAATPQNAEPKFTG